MKTVLMIIFACATILGQSRDELKAKYGDPVSETFLVRPGIVVTATYSATGAIVELLISPRIPDASLSRTLGVKAIDNVVLKQIVDELVPTSKRGKYLMGGLLTILCPPQNDCMGTEENYERLSIYYHASIDGGPNDAVIRWKTGSN